MGWEKLYFPISWFRSDEERRWISMGRQQGKVEYEPGRAEIGVGKDGICRLMLDNLQEAISLRRLVYDSRGEAVDAVLLDANPMAVWALGRESIDEVRGERVSKMLGAGMLALGLGVVREMRASGGPVSKEVRSEVDDRDYLLTMAPVGDKLVLSTLVDITETKRAQRQAEWRAMDLVRSNEDLQQFAFAASHDLQEPLRTIIAYIGLLDRRFGADLDPKAKEYMTLVSSGAERMQELIRNLLQYSRVDKAAIELKSIDMNNVAELVMEELGASIAEVKAEIVVQPLPRVRADMVLMHQLLRNLLTNAMKFRKEEPPRVEVSCMTNGREHVFSVRDNGIGMDPESGDRLFKMFHRLHTCEEYPGTGIGLAISKKIVERHGGRIWFESEQGKGTTFFFTVPTSESVDACPDAHGEGQGSRT